MLNAWKEGEINKPYRDLREVNKSYQNIVVARQ